MHLTWRSNCASGDDGPPYVYGVPRSGARVSTDKENRPNVVVSGDALFAYREFARVNKRRWEKNMRLACNADVGCYLHRHCPTVDFGRLAVRTFVRQNADSTCTICRSSLVVIVTHSDLLFFFRNKPSYCNLLSLSWKAAPPPTFPAIKFKLFSVCPISVWNGSKQGAAAILLA